MLYSASAPSSAIWRDGMTDSTRIDDAQIRMTEPTHPNGLPTLWLRRHAIDGEPTNGQLRNVPYATRGRDVETAQIALGIRGMPASIHLITGAPGSGKSALLANVAAYARQRGCNVINLENAHFATNGSLADAIMNRLPNAPTSPSGTQHQATGEFSAKPARIGTGGAVEHTEKRDDRGPEVWQDALSTIAALNPEKGVLITLDEVQELKDYHHSDECHKRAKALLQRVHSKRSIETTTSQERIMMVCSGLLNANDVLTEQYNLSRIEGNELIRIGPLSDATCQQIIRDHLEVEVTTGITLAAVPEDTIAEIISLCGGYAHRIVTAAFETQRLAYQAGAAGQANLNDEQCQLLVQKTIEGREKLYGMRMTKSLRNDAALAAEVLARATLSWGPQLPVLPTEELLETIAERAQTTKADLTRLLAAKGIIEERPTELGFPTRIVQATDQPHYTFAIHSIATWLNERYKGTAGYEKRNAKLDAMIAEHMPLNDPSERVPPWTWDDRREIDSKEALPKVTPPIRWPVRTPAGPQPRRNRRCRGHGWNKAGGRPSALKRDRLG